MRQRVATALTGQPDTWPYTLHSIYPGLLEAYASMYRLQTGFSCISAAMGLVDRINVRGTMNDGFTVGPFLSLETDVVDADQDKYLVLCSRWPRLSKGLSHIQ